MIEHRCSIILSIIFVTRKGGAHQKNRTLKKKAHQKNRKINHEPTKIISKIIKKCLNNSNKKHHTIFFVKCGFVICLFLCKFSFL